MSEILFGASTERKHKLHHFGKLRAVYPPLPFSQRSATLRQVLRV